MIKFIKPSYNFLVIHRREKKAINAISNAGLKLSKNAFRNVDSLSVWKHRRPEIKHNLAFMLGIECLETESLSNATFKGVIENSSYVIEKWLFEYSNGIYSSANLYIPKNNGSKFPCVVYLCGHWPSLDGAKTGFQDRYLWYPENGFILLVIDPLGFGEIPGIHHGTCRLNKWDWISKGYTPAGVEVWNAMRMVDWLSKREEADINRLAVTGISGGGVMTQYLSALDDRVKVAVASCSTYTIGNQISKNLINGQCDCTFYQNIYGIDFPEVLALIAPRPFLVLGGRKDDIFPPEGFREAYQQVKKVYDLFDNNFQTRLKLVESNEGHTDPPHFLEETRKWICTWLNHEIKGGLDYNYINSELELPERLRVTDTYPVDALNSFIDNYWQKDCIRPDQFTAQRKEYILNVIKERIFSWFPLNKEPIIARNAKQSGGMLGEWSNYTAYTISTESGIDILVQLSLPKKIHSKIPLLVWVKSNEDHVYFPDVDEFFPFIKTHALLIINPRFSEKYLSPDRYAEVERSSALIGRSIATQQVWDVLRAIEWVKSQGSFNDISIFGKGKMAIVSLYAAVLEDSIGHLVMTTPPDTHLKGPAIPFILRFTDIPEMLALMAPRKVYIINDNCQLLTKTKPYFTFLSQENKIKEYQSVAQLLINQSKTNVN